MTHDPILDALRRSATASKSVSGSVAEQLLKLLLGDSMEAGDRLPSERKLTEALGVGRSAVREALAALEVLGVVETRAGSGTYLRSSTSELLPQTLSWSMLVGQEQTEHVAFVRGALERAAAERAAEVVTPDDAATLRGFVRAQREAAGTGDYVEHDIAFHQHLAAMAGNPILSDLLSTSRALLRIWFEHAVDAPDDIETAVAEHDAIAEAIAAGDSAGAQEAMARHMVTATARILRAASQR
ncbi:FadR/GntR family transcriptional regulator [Agrococcus citreus]|uniref:FadR/GntR family transcriptional regulator n=1 Tax=Agrococcus citreus TaxID=84643 RepID=UPI0031D58DE9